MENSTSVEVEEDEIICQCFQVTESKIRSLIVKNDVTEIDDITLACEAGGNCASCHILIQLFIDQNEHKKNLGKTHNLRNANSKKQNKSFWKKLFVSSWSILTRLTWLNIKLGLANIIGIETFSAILFFVAVQNYPSLIPRRIKKPSISWEEAWCY